MEGPINFTVLPRLARKTPTRILFLVMDGLGGCLGKGPTALQASRHPNLDALAARSALGRTIQVLDGITPGSGPGHLALFGYDPLTVDVGRGLLEALGVGADVGPGDVAIRGNLCTVDAEGRVVDRRAGRIPTSQARPLIRQLAEAIPAIEFPDRTGFPETLTISIGAAVLRPGQGNLDTAIAQADQALYQAKNAGRNRVVVAPASGAS